MRPFALTGLTAARLGAYQIGKVSQQRWTGAKSKGQRAKTWSATHGGVYLFTYSTGDMCLASSVYLKV